MGFDDIIFDLDLEQKVLQPFIDNPKLLTQYSEKPTTELLSKWEEENAYCGYSLAYHLLYQIRWTLCQGAHPRKLDKKATEWVALKCREKICNMFHDYYESIKGTPAYKFVGETHALYLGELVSVMEEVERRREGD